MLDQYMENGTLIIIISSYYNEIMEQLLSMQISCDCLIDGFNTMYGHDKRLDDILLPNFFENKGFCEIEGFKLKTGIEHALWKYKRYFLMYDAFVPYLGRLEALLSKEDNKNHWIIDIGANVGDTALGMVKYTSSNILAVEANINYYQLLIENLRGIETEYSNRVKPIQAYISNRKDNNFILLESNGTAKAVPSLDRGIDAPVISVKDILSQYNIDMGEINLIKVDTDGNDPDCIMSCGELLKDYSPVLYYENYFDTVEQYENYLKLCEFLSECNFTNYFVFDCFGNYIGCLDNEALKNINRYLARINSYWSERTFSYIDVLACKEEVKKNVEMVIEQYLKNYPIERYI